MATFTCSACNFSKPVADEMAGKKARCPKCNEVNDIPLNDEVETEAETEEVAEAIQENELPPKSATQTAASVPPSTSSAPAVAVQQPDQSDGQKSSGEFSDIKPIPKNWLMAFCGAVLLILAAAALFVLKFIDLGLVCFAAGILAFAAMSAIYCFKTK